MQADRLAGYGKSGEVAWVRGALLLKPGSVVWPSVSPGPRLELAAELDYPGAGRAPARTRTEFHIPIRDGEALVARLEQPQPEAGEAGEIRLIHSRIADGATRERLLRRFDLPDGLRSGGWAFRYRYGLLRIEFQGRTVASGYLRHDKSVGGIMCFQRQGEVRIRRLELRATARPEPRYTPRQQEAFQAAAEAYSRAEESFQTDDMGRTAREAEQAVAGFRAVLGERHPYTIRAMARLGHAWSEVPGKYAEARDLLDRTLVLGGELYGPEHPEVADVWTRIAGARLVQDDHPGALRAYERAQRLLAETEGPNTLTRGVILIQAGYAAQDGGRSPESRRYLEEAVSVLESSVGPDHPATADAHRELGAISTLGGRFDEAQRHLERALSIASATDPKGRDTFLALLRLVELALARGQPGEAERRLRQALPVAEAAFGKRSDASATILGLLGTVTAEQGRPQEALPFLVQTAEIAAALHGPTDVHTAVALAWLAAAHQANGDEATAAPMLRRALEVELGAAAEILTALSEGEGLEFIQGAYRTGDVFVENARRLGAAARDVYGPVWRSRALVTRLVGRPRLDPGADPRLREELESLLAIRRQLAALTLEMSPRPSRELQTRVDALSEQKEGLERRLASRVPLVARQRSSRRIEPTDLARKLPSGTAVVDFLRSMVGDPRGARYDAFVLRPAAGDEGGRVDWVQFGPAEPIDRAIRSWRHRLAAGRGLEPLEPPGESQPGESPERTLRRLIWDRLEPRLAGIGHVVIIPDSAIARIPWAALPGREPGRVLLEEYALSTVSYGQRLAELLAAAPRPRQETDRALLVGGLDDGPPGGEGPADPAGGVTPRWRPLPGTTDEVEAVASRWPDPRTLVRLTGDAALEAEMRRQLPGRRFIHLASHGFFDDRGDPFPGPSGANPFASPWGMFLGHRPVRARGRNPLALSGVVLSRANVTRRRPGGAAARDDSFDDRILTGEEVVGLDLSGTELVVLSACETGLGDTAGGEGVFGLQRSFELAGASTCIASLWQVPDRATTALMARFYDNLWRKGLGKLAALREVQLWLRVEAARRPELARGERSLAADHEDAEAGRLPSYYWAAFVLSGDWR
jgi:CHAT domain-containing protein/tetratricopeptide (TPR) repeat protein